MYPNRYLCNVLDEMRACIKTLNFSYLAGLIEEVQTMGNRMEAKLEDMDDHARLLKERDELYKEVIELKKERDAIK